MRRTSLVAVILTIPLFSCTAEDLEPRAAASRAAAQEFMQKLKGALQQAIEEGGPVNAITVCKQVAPAMATEMSTQKGWRVARTSLKVRNPANVPDDWERSVLQDFAARRAHGEDTATMEYYERVELDGGETIFRYMKAIPTVEACLVCHGDEIPAAVQNRLAEMYPADQATDFKAGDIRGAFTLTQPM